MRKYFDWKEGDDPKILTGYMSEDVYQVYVKRGLRVNSPGAQSPGATIVLLDSDLYTTEYLGFGQHGRHRKLRVVRMFKVGLDGYWYETFKDFWGAGSRAPGGRPTGRARRGPAGGPRGKDFIIVWTIKWSAEEGVFRITGNAGGEVTWKGKGILTGTQFEYTWLSTQGIKGVSSVKFDQYFKKGEAIVRVLNGPDAGRHDSKWEGAR